MKTYTRHNRLVLAMPADAQRVRGSHIRGAHVYNEEQVNDHLLVTACDVSDSSLKTPCVRVGTGGAPQPKSAGSRLLP